jgi:hypothetical protein
MLGMDHRIRHLAGRGLGLLSMSALLAFACFPVLAQADSSELEYRDAPPAEFKKTPNKNPANSPKTGGQSATSPGSTGDSDSGGKSNDESGAIAGQKDGGGKGGPGSQTGKGDKSGVQPKAIGSIPTSTDDGSSPLAPILIALAVLAAISIGAVVMRRRRESGPGSPVSPEAS